MSDLAIPALLACLMLHVLLASTAQAQTPPTMSDIADQSAVSGTASPALGFAIGDAETPAANLTVTATSGNVALIPQGGLVLGGSGDSRNLAITPLANVTGAVTVTVSVSDGTQTAQDTFIVTIFPPPTLYIAVLKPQDTAQTSASGSATLLLSGDEKSAVVRVSYRNLTTDEVGAHIHGTAGRIWFDLDTSPKEADGSYLWTFVDSGVDTREQQVAAIKAGLAFVNIHSSRYPAGEIRGFYQVGTGSQTFTPPPPPPPLPPGKPTAEDTARFLTQATFGPTPQTIAEVQALGYDMWLANQFLKSTSALTPWVNQRAGTFVPGDEIDDDDISETWWRGAITAPDQLRHRVAWAWSQIFVVSFESGDVAGRPMGVASYHDMLLANGLGNFRTLLQHVTLHPMMGNYLDMRGSRYRGVSPPNPPPNENYAREVLQLFSIGLNLMHPDGTLKLGPDGLPIPTYNQDVVERFSQVFTGWDYAFSSGHPLRYTAPMRFSSTYHSPEEKRLLSYTGNYTPGSPGYDRYVIPLALSQNKNYGPLELKFALDNIFNHPNCGPFISRQLIQRLVTSNPSPGYIYRVARVFNGFRSVAETTPSGPRGDMRAVVKAILTDYEARSPNLLNDQGYGKLREPVLRYTALARAFAPRSVSGFWVVPRTDSDLQQTPFRAPTVFNFYEPDFQAGGLIGEAGLFSPEFQILTETAAIRTSNLLESATRNLALKGNDIRISYAREEALAHDANALVNHLNLLLCSNRLSAATRTIVVNDVNRHATTDRRGRVRAAVHLIVTSPDFTVQK